MKKAFAIIMAVFLLAALVVPLSASAAYSDPPELTAVSANVVGVWPMAAGAYDPMLDGQGIKDGTHIYGCYDFDFTTYVITPKDVPTDIAGYTKVDAPADMTENTYCLLEITGSPNYFYVLVMADPSAEPAAPAASEPAGDAAPASTTAAGINTNPPAPSGSGKLITVSVCLPDGTLAIAAQPVIANTVDEAIRQAHVMYCADGADAYEASIDAQYSMYLIHKCWGVDGTPYTMLNSQTLTTTVDTTPVEEGDNLVIAVSGSPVPCGITYDAEEKAIVALKWTLNMSSFTYTSEVMAQFDVIDPETGKVLGKTSAMGRFTVSSPPACGVVAIGGIAAIPVVPVSEVKQFASYPYKYIPPRADYSIFGGAAGAALLRIVIVCVALTIPLAIIVLHAQRTEIRNRGRKFTQPLMQRQ